jgi:Family of unknown function (DUF6533)
VVFQELSSRSSQALHPGASRDLLIAHFKMGLTFDTIRTLVTVFSVVVYTEYLCNLPQEIRHIWRRKFNLVSFLYLWAR